MSFTSELRMEFLSQNKDEKYILSEESILSLEQPQFISQTIPKIFKFLSISLFLTGLFAIVGALYRWGDGLLFPFPSGVDVSLYITDLVITAPASFLASIKYKKLSKNTPFFGYFVAGIYIYGSALVYATLIQNGSPYPLKLVIPPIFGIALAIILIIFTWKNKDIFCN